MALNQRLGFTRYDADEYYRRALDAFKKGDFDNAIDAMTDAIEMLPTKSEYYAARGFFQLEDAALKEAQADFEQALKLFPYEMLAHYGLGMMAYKAKNWDEALEHFTRAYRADAKRPETLYYLALVYWQKGEPANATNVMAQAQAAFESVGDKRKSHADRWLTALGKLVQKRATGTD
jgi:tetratricopeptide (TPR) repeat protein